MINLNDYYTFTCNTHSPTAGNPTDADSVPTYRIYEDETGTPILTGSMTLFDDDNTTGYYSERIQLTAANGFEVNKMYNIRMQATVGGITGVKIESFKINSSVNVLSGSNTVTLTIQDGSSNNIVSANVEIYDSAGTTFYEKKISNSSGQVVFNLDDGTYIAKVHKAGYSFTNTTLTISGTHAETITGTAYTITAPGDPDLCRLAIYIVYESGSIPDEVDNLLKVTSLPDIDGNAAIYSRQVQGTYSDTTGLLYWDVRQGAEVELSIPGVGINGVTFTVPSSATAEIEDLL